MLYFTNPPALTADQQTRFGAVLEKYVDKVLESSDLPLERVRTVHRLIQQNVIYPRLKLQLEGAINVSVLPEDEEGQHYISAYGALVNERANSYGIARAVDAILSDSRIDIACQLVEGCVIDDDLTTTMHLWNIVTVDGRSFHLDTALEIMLNPQAMRRTGIAGKGLATLDSDELPMIETLLPAYKFCLVSDDVLQGNHLWSLKETPRCLSTYVPAKHL